MKFLTRRFTSYIAVFTFNALLIFTGCNGGGTSGTGLRSFEGKIYREDSTPLENAEIRILETGEWTASTADGNFLLSSTFRLKDVTLKITHPSVSDSVPIGDIPETIDLVKLELAANTDTNTVEPRLIDFSRFKELGLSIRMLDDCEQAFQTTQEGLEQVTPLSQGRSCRLRAQVYGDERPAPGVLVTIDRRACHESSPWRRVAAARTRSGAQQGSVIIPFRFFVSDSSCQYRVTAGERPNTTDAVYIDTLAAPE